MVGIILAVHLLKAEGSWEVAEIGVDSQAAINVLNLTQPAPSHYLVDEVHRQLKQLKREHPTARTLICWIPGHMGIDGNELADIEAKTAMPARHTSSPCHSITHSQIVHQQPNGLTMRSVKKKLPHT